MAGFLEKIIKENKYRTSKYLDNLLAEVSQKYGENSSQYNGLYNQYYNTHILGNDNNAQLRHYQAEIVNPLIPKGLERLYRRSVVIDLISTCASECLYCLRGYYDKFALKSSEIIEIADYCAREKDLKEVLITGGDPFISPFKLKLMITELASKAPNIEIVRIGTRLPVQDPAKFDESFYEFFKSLSSRFLFEIACQINHYVELQKLSIGIFNNLQQSRCVLYSQNVLIKNVNDDIETLVTLYDRLRYLGISPHYLFHAIPLKGTNAFRTSVNKGLDLISKLSSNGMISGRTKPQFALMTDVGKVTLYQGSIIRKENNYLFLKTHYALSDRLMWNKSYVFPDSAELAQDGTIIVKYLDGKD